MIDQNAVIDQAVEAARNAPRTPSTEWVMTGFTCGVQDITHDGRQEKALVFWHANAPDGVRLVFPMSKAGARQIGDTLAGRPTILTPA
jgi:hypothetical protein